LRNSLLNWGNLLADIALGCATLDQQDSGKIREE
jgi:hypothetical protein